MRKRFSSLFSTLLVGRILHSVLWFNFHMPSSICMMDTWNMLRIWILFFFFKKYWNLFWQAVNLLDNKRDSVKVYLLAMMGGVQSSLYSRFSLALVLGMAFLVSHIKRSFPLASWNLEDSSLMKTLIIVLRTTPWQLFFAWSCGTSCFTCTALCVEDTRGALCRYSVFPVCFCFVSSSSVLCPTNSSCLTSPNSFLSLLSKTTSCSIVLMVLPCRKCDHSVPYFICLLSVTDQSPALHVV